MAAWVTNSKLLLSSDTLGGYWLDLIFQIAKDAWFQWIDLSLWKNFDAWNISYVKKLIEKYQISVNVIQLSSNTNSKELNYATELANEIWADVISINPPEIMNYKSYKFITDNIHIYRKQNPNIRFCIINPEKSSLFMLPLPRYYFSNVVEIIKKYKFYLWLDISNIDEQTLETSFMKKLTNFLPYLPVVYIADKSKSWVAHCQLGDWILKLNSIFKAFKQNNYDRYFSLKLNLTKKDLSDIEKVENILSKSVWYYNSHFVNL